MSSPKVPGYIVAEKLGSGSYADVYKAYKRCNNKEVVAIKCVDKNKLSKTGVDNLISEIKILKNLDNEHIVKLKDFTNDDSYIYLIMEYCSGGSLSDFILRHHCLPERLCQRFLQQLIKALKYLREQNISHFDLKPQNILLASKRLHILKLADFGLAQVMSEEATTSLIKGSPLYMAPEIVLNQQYNATADIWSVGIILYECLFGKAPYSSKSFEELINKIKSQKPIDIPSNSKISDDCQNFLRNCLERDVTKRFGFDSFFSHVFVDLEHAPCSESFDKASYHLTTAMNYEKSGKSMEAFSSYNEALKYLLPALHMERDSVKRLQLRKKIASYVEKMEVLKPKNLGNDVPHLQLVEIPANFHRSSSKNNGSLTELLNLTKATPNMTTAIEIAQSGELYEKENKFSLALQKYELALGKLLALLQTEPKGRRRELLIVEMNKWMDRAELLKAIENNSESNMQEAEIEKNCCIQ